MKKKKILFEKTQTKRKNENDYSIFDKSSHVLFLIHFYIYKCNLVTTKNKRQQRIATTTTTTKRTEQMLCLIF